MLAGSERENESLGIALDKEGRGAAQYRGEMHRRGGLWVDGVICFCEYDLVLAQTGGVTHPGRVSVCIAVPSGWSSTRKLLVEQQLAELLTES
jgi:hypothetical protein